MYTSTLPSTSVIDGGEWSTSRPGRFNPVKNPVPIVQEAGWAPGPVWTGAGNLARTGIRSPDRPARSESLYRLRYPDPLQGDIRREKHDIIKYLPRDWRKNPKHVGGLLLLFYNCVSNYCAHIGINNVKLPYRTEYGQYNMRSSILLAETSDLLTVPVEKQRYKPVANWRTYTLYTVYMQTYVAWL